MMKVPVILLNYNSSADCRKCVADLKRQESVELEIIIVDNCSREDDAHAVKELAAEQDCTFIAAKENRGYNAGNNIGLRYAAEKGYKYALIANPDMEFPQRDYVSQLIQVMLEKPDVVVCASNILGVNHERQNPWSFSAWWMDVPLLASLSVVLGLSQRLLPPCSGYCDIVNGCCLLVRMDFIRCMGFFDEQVFLYCEEAILGKQVQRLGRKIFYLHETHAIHHHIESAKGSFQKRYKVFWKSRWYYLKNYSGFNRLQLAIIYAIRSFFYRMKLLLMYCKKIG